VNRKIIILLVLAVIQFIGGCTNTRYLTDQTSVERQREMRKMRSGINAEDVLLNTASFILSITLNSEFEITQSERSFKKITMINEFADTLFINMVTDIQRKEVGYCDIMGIVLPPKAQQRLLVPYPAAYNVYFRTPFTAEEILEIRTDDKQSLYKLMPKISDLPTEDK
jgi:hypothetical protein